MSAQYSEAPVFTKVVLDTAEDGRARFREECITLTEGEAPGAPIIIDAQRGSATSHEPRRLPKRLPLHAESAMAVCPQWEHGDRTPGWNQAYLWTWRSLFLG